MVLWSHSDLNEALKREVERLRIATGEIRTPQQAPLNLGGTQLPYAQACNPSSTYLQIPQSSLPSGHYNNIQLPLFPDAPYRMPTPILHQADNNPLPPSENLQNDPFSCSQGFDISSMGYIASPSESNRAILLPPTSSWILAFVCIYDYIPFITLCKYECLFFWCIVLGINSLFFWGFWRKGKFFFSLLKCDVFGWEKYKIILLY